MKTIIKRIALFSVLVGLIVAAQSTVSNAKVTVKLKANQIYANSDYRNCQKSYYEGSVSVASVKTVAFVLEYRGVDGAWHYQKNYKDPAKWSYFKPGTSGIAKTGTRYTRCHQRLQLNPKGKGDAGLGGIAKGYFYVSEY